MPQRTIALAADGGDVTARLSFHGVARFSAGLYEADVVDPNGWKQVDSLVDDEPSTDSGAGVCRFAAPPAGAQQLFIVVATMTSMTSPGDVGVSAAFEQAGAAKGDVSEAGKIDTGYVQVVVRALLEAS
jgi:hypothetical protein